MRKAIWHSSLLDVGMSLLLGILLWPGYTAAVSIFDKLKDAPGVSKYDDLVTTQDEWRVLRLQQVKALGANTNLLAIKNKALQDQIDDEKKIKEAQAQVDMETAKMQDEVNKFLKAHNLDASVWTVCAGPGPGICEGVPDDAILARRLKSDKPEAKTEPIKHTEQPKEPEPKK